MRRLWDARVMWARGAAGLVVVMLLSGCAGIRWVRSLTGPPAFNEGAFARKPIATYRTSAAPDDTVIGRLGTHRIRAGETFFEVARYYDLGYGELVEANPGIDPILPPVGAPPGAHPGVRRRSPLDRGRPPRQSARQVPHGAVTPALQHPRHGRAVGHRYAGDARLRAALPGGHRAALSAPGGRHACRVHLPARQGRTPGRCGVRGGAPRRLPLRRSIVRPRARRTHAAGAERGRGQRAREGRAPQLGRHAVPRLAGRGAGAHFIGEAARQLAGLPSAARLCQERRAWGARAGAPEGG